MPWVWKVSLVLNEMMLLQQCGLDLTALYMSGVERNRKDAPGHAIAKVIFQPQPCLQAAAALIGQGPRQLGQNLSPGDWN